MHLLDITGLLLSLAALFAYLNHRFFRLPTTVGLMLQSLAVSVLLLVVSGFTGGVASAALFVDFRNLRKVKLDIAVFAVPGVLISTGVVGLLLWQGGRLLGMEISPAYAFLFGALISPTDPVTVLATLKEAGIPDRLNARIAGEALFNDGIGIVLFVTLAGAAAGGGSGGPAAMAALFAREAAGGIVFGGAIGYLAYRAVRSIDDYQVEIMITLALVTGGYALANLAGVSGPLAMVVAGLIMGSRGRSHGMSEKTRENLDRFWELIEVVLNAVLYTLMGLEVLVLVGRIGAKELLVALLAIPVVLFARFVSVGLLEKLLALRREFVPHAVKTMTWSGVRGGIAIALALAVPEGKDRPLLLLVTYVVVVFSILVQGMTVKHWVRRVHR